MSEISIITHEDCLKKFNGINHPECKERLEVILEGVQEFDKSIDIIKGEYAKLEDINLVHPLSYVNNIFSNIPKSGLKNIEKEPYSDTILCENSKNSILASCGAGITASNLIINNKVKKVFCATRPPGHHAETSKAMGFCFINNVAVAARYLNRKCNIKKIAIIDFDVHHGNGTQEIFYNDKNIFYGSIHQSPLFPSTGFENETGVGNICNIPISHGTNSNEFLFLFKNKLLKKVENFKPELIIISAGFDAHKNDPLANINLNYDDFYEITASICQISKTYCNDKIISFLEGGYNLISLKESFKKHLLALSE